MNPVHMETFTGKTIHIEVDGLLFDFDGTLIDSTAAIVKHWHTVGNDIGVDPEVILQSSHGRRSIDVLKLYDPDKANWNYISAAEGRIPREYGQDAVEIPGARRLLSVLDSQNMPWAVVTSGTRALVEGWLDVLKLAHPKTMVVAEDVENGKPDPTCYLTGRKRLRLEHSDKLVVFEDAPAGIRAGKAAGFLVIGLATTHSIKQVRDAGADYILQDLNKVRLVESMAPKTVLEISGWLCS